MKVSSIVAPALVGLAAAQAPTTLTIDTAQTSGNGCPQGSVSTNISADKTIVTFGFDKFEARIGKGISTSEKQKNCQIHLNLKYPQGYQVSLLTATYHGYARLDSAVTANFISSYYFSAAASNTASSRTTLTGGGQFQDGAIYTKEDKIETTSVVWSPCGANGILNVNNRIALSGSGAGEITNDDATLKFEQQVRLSWRRCQLDADNGNNGGNNGGSNPGRPQPGWPQPGRPQQPSRPQGTVNTGSKGTSSSTFTIGK